MKPTGILKSASIFLASLIIFSSCSDSNKNSKPAEGGKLEGTVSLSGAFALYPLANIWAEEFKKIHPDVRFNISAGGAGKGMADALSGSVDLGMVSRDLKEEEKAQGAFPVSVSKDAVLATANASNPVISDLKTKGLSQQKFSDIFKAGTVTTWGQATGSGSTDKISVYTRSDAAGAADVWAKFVGADGQEGLKGIGVFGDPGLAEAVKKDKAGIGFNNVIYVYDLATGKKYDGIEIIPIDINNNGKIDAEENFYDNIKSITAAIADGRYPSPPSRELYFVSKNKPTNPAAVEFLKWVLTDGQKYIEEAGYIKLPEDKIKAEAAKLK
jgi:phosphate transport system substrate-binding protein